MVGRSDSKRWLRAALRCVLVLAISAIMAGTNLHAGSFTGVILSWQHEPGPFSYNVYEATNLLVTPVQWRLVTNTTALTVRLNVQADKHYFRVSCVDTNTGLESLLAAR